VSPGELLALFVVLRLSQQAAEHAVGALDQRYARDPERLAEAGRALRIPPAEMERALAYARDRHRFGLVSSWAEVAAGLPLLAAGALGAVDAGARSIASALDLGAVGTGLAFFAVLGGAAAVFGLPFGLYHAFVIEQRHGFNRQTLAGFLADFVKGLALSAALGGALLAALLAIMEGTGARWWLWAWAVTSVFGAFTAWIYPTLLAPLFNRFTPLPEGELRDRILALAARVGFRPGGLFVMDASRRTAHGNAYFTGLFRQKRIVLFDTLLEALAPGEVVAVLAHELGHFKLRHVRNRLLRSALATGALFWGIGLCLPLRVFYDAFAVTPSSHAALLVFGLWFGLVAFVAQPLGSALSRREEFAADAFAVRSGAPASELVEALLKLREKSRLLPLSHPLYSWLYHSHPPLLERLRALGAAG
jgi:STE24 endopeptidase